MGQGVSARLLFTVLGPAPIIISKSKTTAVPTTVLSLIKDLNLALRLTEDGCSANLCFTVKLLTLQHQRCLEEVRVARGPLAGSKEVTLER